QGLGKSERQTARFPRLRINPSPPPFSIRTLFLGLLEPVVMPEWGICIDIEYYDARSVTSQERSMCEGTRRGILGLFPNAGGSNVQHSGSPTAFQLWMNVPFRAGMVG